MRQKTHTLKNLKLITATPGFTIAELLIVVVVIAIIASITLATYRGVQFRAYDAERIQDIKTIEKALRVYTTTSTNNSFPNPTSVDGSWEQSNEDNLGDFLEQLVSSGTIPKVPVDPINTPGMHYRYYRYGAGTSGCAASRGAFIIIQITDMQTSGRPHPQSPGFSCPSRNWSTEADYTIGIFENE